MQIRVFCLFFPFFQRDRSNKSIREKNYWKTAFLEPTFLFSAVTVVCYFVRSKKNKKAARNCTIPSERLANDQSRKACTLSHTHPRHPLACAATSPILRASFHPSLHAELNCRTEKAKTFPLRGKMRLLHIERITRKPNTKLFDRLSARFVVPDVILGGENRLKCKANAVAAWISIEVRHVTMSICFLEQSQAVEKITPLFCSAIEQKTETFQLL